MVDLLFSTRGRINRLHYWLGNFGVGFAGAILMFAISSIAIGAGKAASIPMLLVLVLLIGVMAWCGVALQVKRFHDRGQSAYWSLLPFIATVPLWTTFFGGVFTDAPFKAIAGDLSMWVGVLTLINFGLFINLGCLPGTNGPNKYGDPPGSPSTGGAPSPQAPRANAASAAFLLGGADKAMEQAIAERARAAATAPAPATPAPSFRPAAAAAVAPARFGRRVTR
jgi:uncharacterized membrane protein YhaH (DUF805 family)